MELSLQLIFTIDYIKCSGKINTYIINTTSIMLSPNRRLVYPTRLCVIFCIHTFIFGSEHNFSECFHHSRPWDMCSYLCYLPDYSKQLSEEKDAFSHLEGSTSSPSFICTCLPSCPEILFSPISSADQYFIHLSNVMQMLTILREPEDRHVE